MPRINLRKIDGDVKRERHEMRRSHVLTSDRSPSSGSGCELTNARQSAAVNVRMINLILIRVNGFCENNMFIL